MRPYDIVKVVVRAHIEWGDVDPGRKPREARIPIVGKTSLRNCASSAPDGFPHRELGALGLGVDVGGDGDGYHLRVCGHRGGDAFRGKARRQEAMNPPPTPPTTTTRPRKHMESAMWTIWHWARCVRLFLFGVVVRFFSPDPRYIPIPILIAS